MSIRDVDLSPLAALGLTTLTVDPDGVTGGWAAVRGMETLQAINGLGPDAFWKAHPDLGQAADDGGTAVF